MSSIQFAQFSSDVLNLPSNSDLISTKKAVSVALGVAISKLIPVPSQNTDGFLAIYDSSLYLTASKYINYFNEGYVIDIELAQRTSRMFWSMRYAVSCQSDSGLISPKSEGGIFEKVMNASFLIDPEIYKFSQENDRFIIILINRILPMLKEASITF